jgi:hypothetical protein
MYRKMALVVFFAGSTLLLAQRGEIWNTKDYSAWSQRECERVLTSSPWVFSATFSEVSGFGMNPGQSEREKRVTFRFRALSAKPIRMAFGRLEMLEKPNEPGISSRIEEMVQAPVDGENHIVLQVEFMVDPPGDSRFHDIHRFLLNANLSDFRDNTRLGSSSKKTVAPVGYRAPTPRQPHAAFLFPRHDETRQEIFRGDEKWISFQTEISGFKIYQRTRPDRMKLQGKFEF